MSEKELYDMIIIGGGPGGLSAGIYCMRASLKTVLLEKGIPGGQMTLSDEVENYPGLGTIGGSELAMKMAEHAREYGLEIVSREVTALVPGENFHEVRLANGDVLRGHAVVLATGGHPRMLDIPGEKECYGKGVSYCAVCDGFFFRDKTVVVVGGGDSATEEGLYLAKLARKVYLIHRRDELRAERLLQKRVFAEKKIEILWNKIVTEISSNDSGVNQVLLEDTRSGEKSRLDTDGVFIFIGYDPNSELVPEQMEQSGDGYVITNEKCETNIPGIYVVGDLREKFARQIVIATGEGCIAALAATHYVENKKALMDD